MSSVVNQTTPNKICKVCKQDLPFSAFQPNSRQCKKCLYNKNKDYFVEYYSHRKASILEKSKVDYKAKTEGKIKQKRGRKPKYNALLLETFSDEDDDDIQVGVFEKQKLSDNIEKNICWVIQKSALESSRDYLVETLIKVLEALENDES